VFRLLRRPRWLALTALVAVAMVAFVQLGLWQLRRLEERRERNAAVVTGERQAAVPAGDVLAADRPVAPGEEWHRVSARGRYDTAHQLLLRNRPLEGRNGFHVLVPLVTATGPAVLVDRGWVPAGASATDLPDVPPPPAGEVTVVGRVRLAEPPKGGPPPPPGQLVRIDVPTVARGLGYPLAGGYVELAVERPQPTTAPTLLPAPEVSDGPHLAYAVQWFLFAVVALVGWALLLRREARDERELGQPRAAAVRRVVDQGV